MRKQASRGSRLKVNRRGRIPPRPLPPPYPGHFDPKGKAPLTFTIEIRKQARASLPFSDTRDFDENKKGLVAPMKDLQIMADAGHVAWDMEQYQFIDQQDEFDSIHLSLHRIAKLNNNYGLYEVSPCIYQVRGFDNVRQHFLHPGQDRLDCVGSPGERGDGACGTEAFAGARGRGSARHGRHLFA